MHTHPEQDSRIRPYWPKPRALCGNVRCQTSRWQSGVPTREIYVRVFVILLRLYSQCGWEKPKQPHPEGKRPKWSVVRGLSPIFFVLIFLIYIVQDTHNWLYKRIIYPPHGNRGVSTSTGQVLSALACSKAI